MYIKPAINTLLPHSPQHLCMKIPLLYGAVRPEGALFVPEFDFENVFDTRSVVDFLDACGVVIEISHGIEDVLGDALCVYVDDDDVLPTRGHVHHVVVSVSFRQLVLGAFLSERGLRFSSHRV